MWVRGEESRPSEVTAKSDEAVLAGVYPRLRRLAAVTGAGDLDPDDLVQEAVVRALAIGPLSRLRDPRAYLSTAIVRIAANDRRSLGRRQQALGRVGADETGVAAAYPSDVALLMRLSPVDRAVIFLAVVEGASAAEIAELVGGSTAAVRMRKARALRRLRTWQREEDPHD